MPPSTRLKPATLHSKQDLVLHLQAALHDVVFPAHLKYLYQLCNRLSGMEFKVQLL